MALRPLHPSRLPRRRRGVQFPLPCRTLVVAVVIPFILMAVVALRGIPGTPPQLAASVETLLVDVAREVDGAPARLFVPQPSASWRREAVSRASEPAFCPVSPFMHDSLLPEEECTETAAALAFGDLVARMEQTHRGLTRARAVVAFLFRQRSLHVCHDCSAASQSHRYGK